MKEDNSFLAKEPVGRLLLKLALPTVTAQIINMLYRRPVCLPVPQGPPADFRWRGL